jgi:hypothetical protein
MTAAYATHAEAWWFMHSRATIQLAPDGTSATLDSLGNRLLVKILSPAGAKFITMEARAVPTDWPKVLPLGQTWPAVSVSINSPARNVTRKPQSWVLKGNRMLIPIPVESPWQESFITPDGKSL